MSYRKVQKVRQTIELISCIAPTQRARPTVAATPSYLSAVVAHFKDGRLPADLARAVSALFTVLQGVGGAAEALPLQLTHPTALDLELGQIWRLGSAAARRSSEVENQYRAGRAASGAKLF